MIDSSDSHGAGFTTSPWAADGIATLEATGNDVRSALEAGLRATLVLAVGPTPAPRDVGRSAPVRGEGDDLSSLFADMVEGLLEHVADFGDGLHDVAVDGVLRREGGGYVAWGYAAGTLEPASPSATPRLLDTPAAIEMDQRIIFRAGFRRS